MSCAGAKSLRPRKRTKAEKTLRCTTCYLRTNIRAPRNGGNRQGLLDRWGGSACSSGGIFRLPHTAFGLTPSPNRWRVPRTLLSPSSLLWLAMEFYCHYTAGKKRLSSSKSSCFWGILPGFFVSHSRPAWPEKIQGAGWTSISSFRPTLETSSCMISVGSMPFSHSIPGMRLMMLNSRV